MEDAWLWYEHEVPGVGEEFKQEFFKKANLITANPLHYPLKNAQIREANLDKFPYLMVYRINDKRNLVRILSVFHTARHPKKKY